MGILLGCIADDFTGATDLANTLTRQGMSTVVLLGVPADELAVPDADAVVIALKSRSIPAEQAVSMSLAALSWLRRAQARQYFFKYCSTFDSTDRGNIGPVAEALLAALVSDFTIACPAFPTNKRTVYSTDITRLPRSTGWRNQMWTLSVPASITRPGISRRSIRARI